MNRDDIIRMAREAGLVPKWLELCPKDDPKALVRFAALIAAAEREECAKVCETHAAANTSWTKAAVKDCADAIRARGNT